MDDTIPWMMSCHVYILYIYINTHTWGIMAHVDSGPESML